jgi:hypothetical protein
MYSSSSSPLSPNIVISLHVQGTPDNTPLRNDDNSGSVELGVQTSTPPYLKYVEPLYSKADLV